MELGGKMVGARGFEPPTSASRTQRSSQAEPRSDIIKVIVEVRDLYISIKKLKSNLKYQLKVTFLQK